ncbi:MAG: methylated-DNA--[protein]-cysteine S-methyltransferase [Breznakibacter sp.]
MARDIGDDFNRIATAIAYIGQNAIDQPDLKEIASTVNMSPFHFQRVFSEWAGVSPKKFLQGISLNQAKQILAQDHLPLEEVADRVGLSGIGRLHDLFVSIEGMTPGEYKNGGVNLKIEYAFLSSCFGRMLCASTSKGICHLAFVDGNDTDAVKELVTRFPNAVMVEGHSSFHARLNFYLGRMETGPAHLHLHLKGTPFQLKVWEALLQIPEGQLTTYGKLARQIGAPNASRAVGSAVGDNPIAWIIPCHRVILSTGHFGQYHWGVGRKSAMIGIEKLERMGGHGL